MSRECIRLLHPEASGAESVDLERREAAHLEDAVLVLDADVASVSGTLFRERGTGLGLVVGASLGEVGDLFVWLPLFL